MKKRIYDGSQITIGILTFNRWKYTKATLENLLKHTAPSVEIILSDNGSTDGTVTKLHQFFAQRKKEGSKHQIKIIDNKKNLGIGRAINQILAKSSRQLFIKLDNDILVYKDWLYFLWGSYKFFGERFGACCLEVRNLFGTPEVPKSATAGHINPIHADLLFEHTTVVNGAPLALPRSFWLKHKFAEDRLYGHEDARFVMKVAASGLVSGQIRSSDSWVTHLQGDNAYRKYDLWKLHTSSRGDFDYRKNISCLPLDGDGIVAKEVKND